VKALRFVLALALAALPALGAAQEKPLAIRGARVVTVSGPVIEKGVVVVERGRIVAVGADVAVPAGATVVDGTGKTLYPGLVDALTTLGLAEVSAVSATMDTTEVGDMNPQAHAWVALHPDSEPCPYCGGNLVRQPAYRDAPYRIATPLVNSDFVMDRVFWIGVYPGITPAIVDYVVETVHALPRVAPSVAR
jgi:hypothetical protein